MDVTPPMLLVISWEGNDEHETQETGVEKFVKRLTQQMEKDGHYNQAHKSKAV